MVLLSQICQKEVEYPVTYATCGTFEKVASLSNDEKSSVIALLRHVADWLQSPPSHELAELNKNLVIRLKSLIPASEGEFTLAIDSYCKSTGGTKIVRAQPLFFEDVFDSRPALTRDAARSSYAWGSAQRSFRFHDCILCVSSLARNWGLAYNCRRMNRRPGPLDVLPLNDKVWIRPCDVMKAAFYHNLLTLYAIAFFLFEEDKVLEVLRIWESKLFP